MNRSRAVVLALVATVASCELLPGRTGTCQPPAALALGTFIRAEAFHDDCRGPDRSGDIFTFNIVDQTNVLFVVTPEETFAPTLQIYRGTYGDVNPPLVADLNAGTNVALGVRTFLGPGNYFLVAGTSTRDRASYRISAATAADADCQYWNFTTPGVELNGAVTTADCTVIGSLRSEAFELWRAVGDSVTVTVIADSAGTFSFGEACCEFTSVFSQALNAGDSVTFGHRAPRRRPYRAAFHRDVGAVGPATYRLRFQ